MASIVASEEQPVLRPLKTLITLIREDVAKAEEALAFAGKPFYIAIGEKLEEAKAQLPHGDFIPWVQRHFNFGRRQASEYMNIARKARPLQMGEVIPISLRDAIKEARPENPNYGKPAAWRVDVDKARDDAIKMATEASRSRQEERDAERKMALRLVDIGYKILAKELHPDKRGGSRDAMARLNRVRERLKSHA